MRGKTALRLGSVSLLCWPWLFATFVLLATNPATYGADDLGLRLPPGFRATLYADENLANDIYAMTLDAHGRVVVTGPGYIKTLHDSKSTGKADRATVYATPGSGGMGLCFDGPDLLFCGGGWLSRYHDADGNGEADGPPERYVPLAFGEHGGHAMRKGPDGFWYVIGGNDAGIDQRHVQRNAASIQRPEAGGMLRLTPDGRKCEVIAQGFRNPYDFDFNSAGDLFTYDSDVERDIFLPWYSPTRMYHVAIDGHHGWRLNGYMRSWARRDYFVDTVDVLWPVGRGSPTGVVCYRHDQFPEHYRDGVFALDWTFGKVFFFPLRLDGSTYRTDGEVFLEPTGTVGFAPTDAAVGPDGSLFISIGGRKTRGAVYRIEYVGEPRKPSPSPTPETPLAEVLLARQPLDAWSREQWVPKAKALGDGPFQAFASDSRQPEASRVRAIEVLTEVFDGPGDTEARLIARAPSPLVRARVAWSLGRRPKRQLSPLLATLAQDASPVVRLAALEAIADQTALLEPEPLVDAVLANLGNDDKRVRQATARLAAALLDPLWTTLDGRVSDASPQARLTAALARILRNPDTIVQANVVEAVLPVLKASNDPSHRLQAVRLIERALGDYHLINPDVEIDTAYSLSGSRAGLDALTGQVRAEVRSFFPTGSEHLDDESGRLLAMLEDDDSHSPHKVADFWTKSSTATRDMHFLIIFSRLKGPLDGPLTARVAQTILGLDAKLQGQAQRTKQSWDDRLGEVLARLLRRDPTLSTALLESPNLVGPSHVAIAMSLTDADKTKAARKFLEAVQSDDQFPWSGPLLDLLGRLPANEVLPAYRAHWEDFGLRDALLYKLARAPEQVDRDKFLWGLEATNTQVVSTALSALERLPRDPTPTHLVPVLRLLRRLSNDPKEGTLRRRTVALLSRQAQETFPSDDTANTPQAIRKALEPILDWFQSKHPELVKALNQGGDEDLAAWKERLKTIQWDKGDPAHGAILFRDRACQGCHAGPRALGPDLNGVTNRFSRDDLFTAVLAPNLDVSPAYRTTLLETSDGNVYSGMVAFESADGLILQTSATTTLRLASSDVTARRLETRSLMPTGLLKDLAPTDLADLFAYLRTLSPTAKPQDPTPRKK